MIRLLIQFISNLHVNFAAFAFGEILLRSLLNGLDEKSITKFTFSGGLQSVFPQNTERELVRTEVDSDGQQVLNESMSLINIYAYLRLPL